MPASSHTLQKTGRLLWRYRLPMSTAIVLMFFALQLLLHDVTTTQAAFSIAASLRLNDNDSAYLNRTPASSVSRDAWTLSMWVKRGNIATAPSNASSPTLWSADTTADDWIRFDGNDKLAVRIADTDRLISTQVFRDPSTWFHLVVVYDAANSTAANRLRVYVDGVEVTAWDTDARSGITTGTAKTSTNVVHNIGRRANGSTNYFDGYLADVYFTAVGSTTASHFGQYDANGFWRPKPYGGSFGTNGFHLDFANGSDLGNDVSGKNNDWTSNGLDAGDKMIDTPSNSFATLNVLNNFLDCVRAGHCTSPGVVQLSNGNLKWIGSATIFEYRNWSATVLPDDTAQYYFEVRIEDEGSAAASEQPVNAQGCSFNSGSFVTNDLIGFAIGTSSVYVHKNGTWQNSATLSDVENGNSTNRCAARNRTSAISSGDNSATTDSYISGTFIFGQTANPTSTATTLTNYSAAGGYFQYAPPSGYKALSTANFPALTIQRPKSYFDAKTYTGTAANQTITGLKFKPDFVWLKDRTSANDHGLFDAVRTAADVLISNRTNAELASSTSLTAFNGDGFSVGTDGTFNTSNNSYISWNWKESATAGFDIVTYTGDGANRTVSHSLGVVPDFIVVKDRTTANDWAVYHRSNTSAPETDFLLLNSTAATADDNTYWNDTKPTASVFSLGTNADVNTNNDNYVAYLFASTTGFSSFGSYSGNGNADGPFVWTGFKPKLVLYKISSATGNWFMQDTVRSTYNPAVLNLYPNLTDGDFSSTANIDYLSNGFKIRNSAAGSNDNGATFLYAAFADIPFKLSGAAPAIVSQSVPFLIGSEI